MLKDNAVISRSMLKFEKEVVMKADVAVIENLKAGRTRGTAAMSLPTQPTTYETSPTTTILTTITTGKP
ncbi:hypothetical protein DVR12_05675 [Chitinophaga silvatica]|uniref:Uncharacterized protein n=1 Tax=Chitinophaga silvatica TaxID=2282649 RepID=A0A3E1YDK8_9BACT|nr:hypothetical protein [Chitinophaga silvatica]RFS24690.1 hypothetical protein DVR12_05675 [Chitinophaga silvatica]